MLNRTQWIVLSLMGLAIAFLSALLAYVLFTSTALAQNSQNEVCPLSDDQSQKSVEAFDKIAKVFTTEPRCVNCHGAVNPFADDAEDTHGGGKIDVIRREETINGHTITSEDTQATFDQCQDCHDAFPGRWHIPGEPLFFVGQDALTLCQRQKRLFDAAGFVGHIEHDADPTNPFVQEAFTGRMGLDEDARKAVPDWPKKPSLSQGELVLDAKDWVDAQGGKFRGSEECGCKPLNYALKLTGDEGVTDAPGTTGTVKGSATIQIPFKFKDDGSFTGETQVDITYSGTIKDPDAGSCTTTMVMNGQTWSIKGNDGEDDHTLHITLTVKRPSALNKGTCTADGRTAQVQVNIPGGEKSYSFDMPAQTDTTTPLTLTNPQGGFDKFKSSVVETSQ